MSASRNIAAMGLLIGTLWSSIAMAVLIPHELRTEYRTDPLGIDVMQPRLEWKLRAEPADVRDLKQQAYQILVASTPALLARDTGDLWDSGRVESDRTNQIAYAGKALTSGQRAFWKVRAWQHAGQASSWSEPAKFSVGLLQPSDWSAKWIGYDVKTPEQLAAEAETNNETLTFEGLNWMWSPTPADAQPLPTRYFRKIFTLPPGTATRGHGVITADSGFDLVINGTEVVTSSDWRKPKSVQYMNLLLPGEQNTIMIIARKDGEGPGGLVGRFRIKIDGQPSTIIDVDSSWEIAPDGQGWETPHVVAKFGDEPWGRPPVRALVLPPPPFLRKEFAITKPIVRATAYASALGLYELHLNGQRVGQDHLTPGWTEYNKRVYYQTHDVTALMKEGPNAIGAILGDGWYAGYWHADGKRGLWGDQPRAMIQLNLEYFDGTRESIITDGSWKASYGPIQEADLLMGETYDANRELTGWNLPGYADRAWQPVAVTDRVTPQLQASPMPPVRVTETIPAKSVRRTAPNTYVFDLGQNIVGWTRLKLQAVRPGTKLTLRFSEMLNDDGSLYTVALRSARAIDTYVSKGGEFVWEPKFTFHGFRYVELSGFNDPPHDAVIGVVAHTPMQSTGSFESSNPLVNQLYRNIIWGQKGNYLEVPMDCPQRDERLGWTGDAQFFIPTAAYNFDVAAFFTKWQVDLNEDAVNAEGAFASIAPDVYKEANRFGATGWADAGIICPYYIYKVYGDTRIIERHYGSMAKYIDYLQKTSTNYVRGQGLYGDWVNLGGGAKSEVIGTAYSAYVTRLMSEMSAAIGKTDDARRFRDLADKIRETFIREFVTSDGKIKESSQTGFALAFAFDLLPPELQAKAAEVFVEEIRNKDWHLATGFIGTPILLPALSKAGRDDVAYRLLLQESFPGWLYQVKLGATTMWERWDGYTPEKGFFNPGMNSFNHYAFGSVGAWLYRTVGGIDSEGPGFRNIIIRPKPSNDLTWAKTSYDSIHGTIATDWRIENGIIRLNVTIPPNTSATIYVPSKEADKTAIHRVGSGTYQFTGTW